MENCVGDPIDISDRTLGRLQPALIGPNAVSILVQLHPVPVEVLVDRSGWQHGTETSKFIWKDFPEVIDDRVGMGSRIDEGRQNLESSLPFRFVSEDLLDNGQEMICQSSLIAGGRSHRDQDEI